MLDHLQGDCSVLHFVDAAVVCTIFIHLTIVKKKILFVQFISSVFCTNKVAIHIWSVPCWQFTS